MSDPTKNAILAMLHEELQAVLANPRAFGVSPNDMERVQKMRDAIAAVKQTVVA